MRLSALYHRAQLEYPRLRLIGVFGKFRIFEVDGNWIRTNREPNFTSYGQHFRFPKLIPDFEGWIDRGATPEEIGPYIVALLSENRAMGMGVPYESALDIADRSLRAELRRRVPDPPFAGDKTVQQQVELRVIKVVRGIRIVLVNGPLVRKHLFVDFTEGGHDLVYNFIPQNTVWIDSDLRQAEWGYTILHELFERSMMARGMTYDKAHVMALVAEWGARNDVNYQQAT
mgnify:FL=1